MDSKKQINKLSNAINTTAESSLAFYRAAIKSGATEGEATRLLQAYIAAMAFGNVRQKGVVNPQRKEGANDNQGF